MAIGYRQSADICQNRDLRDCRGGRQEGWKQKAPDAIDTSPAGHTRKEERGGLLNQAASSRLRLPLVF